MKKLITILLAIMMAFTLVGCGNKSEETEAEETVVAEGSTSAENETTTPMRVTTSGEKEKKEIVYALLDASGNSTEIIVSDELMNYDAGTIKDKSDLADIENVKGDETFSQDGNDLTWNSDGDNIFYQGTSTKQLPISVKVTYTLDGKEMSADEIEGKSGHVTIRYDFTNNTSETVNKKSYIAPFICLGGTILDNEHFYNIKLTNGEAIDDGNHTAVAGYAIPGIINSLNLKQKYTDKIGDKSYFMIEADANDFTMSNVFLAVSNKLVSDVDDLDTSSFDDLESDIDKLADGMKEIKDGSVKLADGADELKDGLAELARNSSKLTDGSSKVYDLIIDTVKSQIRDGLEEQTVTTDAGTQRKYTDEQIDKLVDAITKDNYKAAIYDILGTNFDRGIIYAVYGMRQDGSTPNVAASSLNNGVLLATGNGEAKVKQVIAQTITAKQIVAQKLNTSLDTVNSAVDKYTTKSDAYNDYVKYKDSEDENEKAIANVAQIAIAYYETMEKIPTAVANTSAGTASAEEQQIATAFSTVLTLVNSSVVAYTKTNDTTNTNYIDAQTANTAYETYKNSTNEDEQKIAQAAQIALAYYEYMGKEDTISSIVSGVLNAITTGESDADASLTLTSHDTYSRLVIDKCMASSTMETVLKTQIENILTKVLDPNDSTKDPTANISESTILAMKLSLTKDQDLINTLSNEVLNDMLKTEVINKDESTSQLLEAITNLADYGTFNDGLNQYTAGVYSAYKGSKELKEGAIELRDGIKKFDDEGVSKLVDVVKTDLKNVIDNLDNLKEAGKAYDIYSDKADGVKSSVSFVYRIDAIGE